MITYTYEHIFWVHTKALMWTKEKTIKRFQAKPHTKGFEILTQAQNTRSPLVFRVIKEISPGPLLEPLYMELGLWSRKGT